MTTSGFPKISFGIIVLNGEPFTRYCLRALYPYAHEIVVVEGAVTGAAALATEDGHSRDGTLEVLHRFVKDEDPEGKVKIITRDGFWEEKDQQSQAYASVATGDWLWQVDIDEFYLPEDIEFIGSLLNEQPEITAVSFVQKTFWGSPEYECDSTYLQQGARVYHRLFKWGQGYSYSTHRPPTVVDRAGISLRDINHCKGEDLAAAGVYLYHYSLLLPKQVREKVAYYSTWNYASPKAMPEWMNKNYFGMTNAFNLHNVNTHPGWLVRYNGKHPPEIALMWSDIQAGILEQELRDMSDVESFVDSPSYRKGILSIHQELNRRTKPNITMQDKVLHNKLYGEECPQHRSILQLSTNESRGGAAQIHYSLSKHLNDDKQELHNVASFVRNRNEAEPWCKEIYSESIEKHSGSKETALLDYDIASSFYLLQKPEFIHSDIVHLHNTHGEYFNPLALPLVSLKKPTVWTLHDMFALTGHCGSPGIDENGTVCDRWKKGCKTCPHLSRYPALKKDVSAELFRDKRVVSSILDTTLVSPSQWLADRIADTFLSRLDCAVIPNGIDTSVFVPYSKEEARKLLGLPQNAFVLTMTAHGGMKNTFKGGHYLEAAASVLQKSNPNLIVLNVGGEYYSESVNIRNLPFTSDKRVLALAYSAGDVLAYPSLADNYPLVVPEAMACGLPVVAFATGGIPEQIIDGETGLVVEYGNVEQFTMALASLMGRPALRVAMAQKAAAHGSTFSIQKMADAYSALYEQVIEKRAKEGGPDVAKHRRALEYLRSRLEQINNRPGVEAYNNVLAG